MALLRPTSLLGAGSEAPSFSLEGHDGGRISSDDLAGEHHYVLVFYPSDRTPGCTAQLQAFSARKERFAQEGCLLFGVNPGSAASHREFAEEAGVDFPLLVDSDRQLATAYRTARPGLPRTFRAVFVIDKKGIVRLSMKDSPDPDAVLRMVERSNETGYKGTGRKGRRLVPEVSAYGLRKLHDNDPATRTLDIREEIDWETGHIPGAISVPIDSLIQRLDELPTRDTPIVVACDQGLRAPSAARILRDSGWRKVYTLIDGMEAYKGPLETG